MNILHHKSWHVLRKDNIARVRKDEAKAAAEEQAKLDRVKLAEHEDRMNRMRRKAGGDQAVDQYQASSSKDQPSTGHVNFFEELEAQERNNLATGGNKAYQSEKKREQHEWESKMGIMKRFAEDTKELSGESNWWENIDRAKSIVIEEEPKVIKVSEKELRRQLKKQKKEEKKRKKAKKRRRRSSSTSSSDSDKAESKRQKLENLRKERLERERAEQRRAIQLVGGTKSEAKVESKADERPKRPSYSNQFNPGFVRR